MRTVRELLSASPEMRPSVAQEVRGYLIVTGQLTILCESEVDRGSGIIVPAPGLIEQWTKAIPAFGGSRVYFTGSARVRGKFGASGIPPLPLIVVDLEWIEFKDRHGHEARYGPQ